MFTGTTRSNTLTLATAKFSDLGCYINDKDKVEILGVMMVASSYDYDETIRLLESSFLGNIYSRLLVMQFKTLLQSNIDDFLSGEELDNYHNAMLLTDMDQVMYKTYGFSSKEEFLGRMQMKYFLGSVKVPMLTLVPPSLSLS
jgi:predicted alpha/beta-fold hydrolase